MGVVMELIQETAACVAVISLFFRSKKYDNRSVDFITMMAVATVFVTAIMES